VKLNGLLALYTSCPTPPTRYLVLLQLLKFAQQSKQLSALLVPVIKVRTHTRPACHHTGGLTAGIIAAHELLHEHHGVISVCGVSEPITAYMVSMSVPSVCFRPPAHVHQYGISCMMPAACLWSAVVCVSQGKADEWRRAWGLKPSMAYELYIHLANVMKVRGGAL